MIERPFRFLRRTPPGGGIEYMAQFLEGLAHPDLLRSGATLGEERRPLPGDDLVPHPMWEATRAITVHAPMSKVWPWVVQMGYGRGGWYGWNPLERADTGVSRLLPGFQSVRVGDVLLDGPGCHETKGAWRVRAVEPPTTLVLYSLRDPITGRELDPAKKPRRFLDCAWAFVLRPVGAGTTRLLARTRVRFGPHWAGLPLTVLPAKMLGGGDTVMQRRLLEGIRLRAERAGTRPRRGSASGRESARSRRAPASSRPQGARRRGVA